MHPGSKPASAKASRSPSISESTKTLT
jgi:hypothetical protein